MEENNKLRAGLAGLFDDAEFAATKAKSSRACVLRVTAIEARNVRGAEQRRSKDDKVDKGTEKLHDLVANVHFGDVRRRTETRRSTSSPRWDGLDFEFAIGTWTEELLVSLHDASGSAPRPASSAAALRIAPPEIILCSVL